LNRFIQRCRANCWRFGLGKKVEDYKVFMSSHSDSVPPSFAEALPNKRIEHLLSQ
jgi:hypothetical protein